MAVFFAQKLKEYMTATNNAWPPELIKDYVQTQQLYEDTHHGWPCGWIPGLWKRLLLTWSIAVGVVTIMT